MGLRAVTLNQEDYEALARVLAENNLLAGDLEGDHKRFYAFVDESGWSVGVGGLELYGDSAILRSFLTMGCHRGQGLGEVMLEQLVDQARACGVKTLYLLTETAEGFFARHGFTRIDRAQAPDKIRKSAQFSRHCQTASFMIRHL